MLSHHQKVWDIALKKQGRNHLHSHTPLWNNSFMPELSTILDPGVWASYGILFLSQVMSGTGPKSYNRLREEFSLPPQLHFRYLQLRHALRAQMGSDGIEVSSPQVLDVIFGKDSAKLTSNCYYVIRRRRTNKIMQVAKLKWERDLGIKRTLSGMRYWRG